MDTRAILCLMLAAVLLSGCVSRDSGSTTTSLLPEGGLAVGISPRSVSVSPGGSEDVEIEVYNNENIDDTVRIYLAVDDLPSEQQADLSWFNWTDVRTGIAAGEKAVIPLRVSVPEDVSGWRAFRVRVESVSWGPEAFDTGVVLIRE